MKRSFVLSAVLFFCLIIGVSIYFSSNNSNRLELPGYIEDSLTYISSEVSGQLISLNVREGQTVKMGTLIAQLQTSPLDYQLKKAGYDFKASESKYKNLLSGDRQPTLNKIKAQISQAEANLNYQKKNYHRVSLMNKSKLYSTDKLQNAHNSFLQAKRQVEILRRELEAAKLPARQWQIQEAKAQALSNYYQYLTKKWDLDQARITAPISGQLFDTFYKTGEYVQKGQPIVALFNPNDIKLIFFIPQRMLSQIKLGNIVEFSSLGHQHKMRAKISYISPSAEYTPPVIYSESVNEDLTYKIEASVSADMARKIHPGQPTTVYLSTKDENKNN